MLLPFSRMLESKKTPLLSCCILGLASSMILPGPAGEIYQGTTPKRRLQRRTSLLTMSPELQRCPSARTVGAKLERQVKDKANVMASPPRPSCRSTMEQGERFPFFNAVSVCCRARVIVTHVLCRAMPRLPMYRCLRLLQLSVGVYRPNSAKFQVGCEFGKDRVRTGHNSSSLGSLSPVFTLER